MKQKLLLLLIVFTSLNAFSQKSYWKPVSSYEAVKLTAGQPLFTPTFQPKAYSLFTLDENVFRSLLATVPEETRLAVSASSFVISIPAGNGKTEKFRIIQSPVMQPKLQAKHPDIRSYTGKGIDNPASSIYFDISPAGFHGMILSAGGPVVYINPVNKDNRLYVVFNHNQATNENKSFTCKTETTAAGDAAKETGTAKNANDGKLRTYRFAVESGGEFSKLFLDGSETNDEQRKAKVLAALVTDLVRINGIFETDFGVHLNYIDNEDTIIFLDSKTDPFVSSSLSGYFLGKWNTQSQQTLNTYIGAANYDVGHLLMGIATGGNAGCIGCVCQDALKGSGVTGFVDDLTSDPFVVDYWAHEIGHQFGGNHTFDYSNEGTIAQMEPGSASTIMGYAGTTGGTDIQPHSDPYFHGISIQQITDYIQGVKGNACAEITNTGDKISTANAGADYTIPASTPFVLAGSGTDADAGDVLTYCWEQFDNFNKTGSNKYPGKNSTTGSVFRSYNPTVSNTRTFPQLSSILDGSNQNEWEVLPGVSRPLNFRLTVRDNHTGGGSNNSDDMKVTVDGNSGPFKITSPNTAVSIGEGTNQIITWDVANTNTAPVNCDNVKILLSLDGGITFPYILSASTPNNGIANVSIPLITASTTMARVKIESIGNIFFDINDADFSIDGTLPVTWLSFTAEKTGIRSALLKWATANEINSNHFEVERSADGIRFIKVGTVQANGKQETRNDYSFTDNFIPNGISYYRIKQVDNDGHYTYSIQVRIIIDATGISCTVSPNPASDFINLAFNATVSAVSVSLVNGNGKMVFTKNSSIIAAGETINIPVQNLPKGLYFVKIKTQDNLATEKIVISR